MRSLSAIIFLGLAFIGKAQLLDTSSAHDYHPLEVYSLDAHGLLWLEEDSTEYDTFLHDFSNSYAIYREGFPFLDLGFEGSPNLILKGFDKRGLELNSNISSLDYYLYDEKLNRYHTSKPFTRLNYSQGANELIYIEATHAQQISERLTFGVDYRRIKNQNFYFGNIQNADNQRFTNLFNIKFYTGYYSKDRKYELLAGFIYNKNENIETGGLEDKALFEQISGRNKLSNNSVYLSSASNDLAQHIYKIKQYYRLSGSAVDTTAPGRLDRFSSQLVHQIAYRTTRNEYIDERPDSVYYGKSLLEVNDSIYHSQLENKFGIMLKLKSLKFYGGITYQYDHIYQDSGLNNNYNAFVIDGKLQMPINKALNIQLKASYALSGYNANGYEFNGALKFKRKKHKAKLKLHSSLTETDFLNRTFRSDVISWGLNFDKVLLNDLSLNYKYQLDDLKLNAELNAQSMSSPVYMDSDLFPKQWNGTVLYASQAIDAEYNIGPLGLKIKAMHQSSSVNEVLPLPEWSAYADLYLNMRFFKKKLLTQLGVNSQWFSDFNAPMYNSYMRRWVNTTDIFEYYSPINVYFNTKLKSLCLGVNIYHVQQGFMGESYYASSNYPIMPRAVRLNIRWDLTN